MSAFGGPYNRHELEGMGITPDAKDEVCPYCGKALDLAFYIANGTVVFSHPEPCGCEGERKAEEEREAADLAEKRLKSERARRSRYLKAGIPKRFLDARVQLPQSAAYLSDFAEAHGHGLYIHGKSGRGKTYAASALAKEFVDAGYSVTFTTAGRMLESVKSTFDGNGSTADELARYTTCDMLILDDLGKENTREWSVNTIFMVMNERYEAMLPIIITSNFSPAEIAGKMGRRGEREAAEAIASRIAETCTAVYLSGPDRRTGKM